MTATTSTLLYPLLNLFLSKIGIRASVWETNEYAQNHAHRAKEKRIPLGLLAVTVDLTDGG